MNGERTLKEVCRQLKITRRTLQGYQVKGLVQPDGKNKYGHLLYKEKTMKKIAVIHFYQQLGFSLKEIEQLFNFNSDMLNQRLSQQLNLLQERQQKLLLLKEQTITLINLSINNNDIDLIYEIISKGEENK